MAWDLVHWCGLLLRPRESLEAEIPFLRRQLALYRERGVKPRRVDAARPQSQGHEYRRISGVTFGAKAGHE